MIFKTFSSSTPIVFQISNPFLTSKQHNVSRLVFFQFKVCLKDFKDMFHNYPIIFQFFNSFLASTQHIVCPTCFSNLQHV